MYGFEAITHYHGLAIAAVGITIVFTALVALFIILSQLHKLLGVWENREAYIKRLRRLVGKGRKPAPARKPIPPQDLHESARQFSILIKSLGEPFSLPKLIEMAEIIGIGRPHSTVNSLMQAGLI